MVEMCGAYNPSAHCAVSDSATNECVTAWPSLLETTDYGGITELAALHFFRAQLAYSWPSWPLRHLEARVAVVCSGRSTTGDSNTRAQNLWYSEVWDVDSEAKPKKRGSFSFAVSPWAITREDRLQKTMGFGQKWQAKLSCVQKLLAFQKW